MNNVTNQILSSCISDNYLLPGASACV